MSGSILYYDVRFQDDVKQMVRANNVREVTKEDQIILDKFNAEIEQKDATQSVNESDKKGDDARRAEAELLLAIQNPHIKNNQAKNGTAVAQVESPVVGTGK